jgi:hypothetical protein
MHIHFITGSQFTTYIFYVAHPQRYSPCTSFELLIFYAYLYNTLLIVNLTKVIWIFNCGFIPMYYNCNCILGLSTLKMATWVAETCRWLLCNKITFIHSSAFVFLFKNFIHLIIVRNMKHIKYSSILFVKYAQFSLCI